MARRHKLLYLIDTLEIGGTEKSVLDIVSGLDRTQFEAVVCHIYPGDRLRSEFEQAGVRVVSLELAPKYHLVRGIRLVSELVRKEKPALIHTALFRADQVGRVAGLLTRTPVVSSLVNVSYDPIRLQDNPHLSWLKLRGMQLLDACTARWVRRFHAVAESVKAANARHLWISPKRIAVVHRGRDVSRYNGPRASDGTGTLSRDPVARILAVGRLIDQKGHRYLVEGLPAVLRAVPTARLQLAGAGWLEQDLRTLTNRLEVGGAVDFLGARDDVPELLRHADLFVLPSLFEGLPGALVEAMLSGCPVVASDLPVCRELIDDGVHGRLVPPMNPLALAEVIVQLLRDPQLRLRLGHEAQRRARERFDIRNVVKQMEEFYEQVLR